MIKKLLLFFMILGSMAAQAQNTFSVSGVVMGEDGETLPGVSVIVKGTSRGVSTGFDGTFKLNDVVAENTLIFSFIGMKPQEYLVGNQTHFEVSLMNDVESLEEVVIVGYGVSKSKDLTAPIASVGTEELKSMSNASAVASIQGKVAGVNIVNNGAPGEAPKVNIRGAASINDDAQPLYVVDGMFVDNINFVNPADIETMTVLKDASASAIYGVKAANGVILITTKSGTKNQKMSVSYDGYYGVQEVTQRLQMANSAQYAGFMRASGDPDLIGHVDNAIAMYGGANGVPSVSTDWYNELIKSAPIQNHSVSLNGGTDKSSYSFGLSYFDQGGIMDYGQGNYERLSLRTRVDTDVSDHLKIGFNMMLSTEKKNLDENMAWFQAYTNNPMYPVMDADLDDSRAYPVKFANAQDLGYNTYYNNPAAVAYYQSDNSQNTVRVLPNIFAELKPFAGEDITFRTSLNLDYRREQGRYFTPEYQVGDNLQQINTLKKDHIYNTNMIWDNTATWLKNYGNHNITVLAGFSVREENWRILTATAQGVADPNYINTGDESTRTATDNGTRYRGLSGFSRVSYNYADRYLVSATMRADGSSKYQDKWGYFPSVGLGWVVSEEQFFQNLNQSTIDFFKIRSSYGLLGNDNGPSNNGFASINNGGLNESGVFGPGNMLPGMIQNGVYSYLTWEMTEEFNIGFDTKLLDYRLNVEGDYFIRNTRDMIIRPTPPNGLQPTLQNAGTMQNRGIELAINWSDKIGDFHYSIGGNATYIKNQMTDLNGAPYIQEGSAEYPQMLMPGESIYAFYGYKIEGIYQNQAEIDDCPIAQANNLKPGDFKYQDVNDDGVIDEKDRQILGDPNPDWVYGLNLNVGYKGWSLSAAFMGSQGATIFNRKRADINKHPRNNIDANLANNFWTGEGSTNAYPSAEGMFNTWNNGRLNDFFLEDASFFRLQNVRISYSLPQSVLEKLKMTNATIFVNADRPYTWFNTNGFTPEVYQGVDQSVYPIPAVFSLGANLTF
ncbi:SusC/RagA family TonB-linked outer membrane protein [Persicobacter diffluens]|uniref:SusC/RagA family TonB-linked outer membrane protein n=2 Tax=Persicobacter diffluens TaxID=981 RepID=A0AAN4W0I8_9BACT|nr:SusC/RagA family TonB-linked outer membrane protein [Persicobacter diffluens]